MIASHELSDELAALRRRAYGPDADIESDPPAMRRLDELEDLWLRRTLASTGLTPASASDPEDDAQAADSELPRAMPARGWGRAGWVVAAAGLAIGLVIGGAAALFSSRPVVATPDVTLGVVSNSADQSATWLANLASWGVSPGSVRHYESFQAIDVWVGDTPYDDRCLLLSHERRIFMAQCAATGLDPVLDLSVDAALPIQLGESIPYGTMIRFVARADAVDVWARQGQVEVTSPEPAARTG